jgi:hypothetical protein
MSNALELDYMAKEANPDGKSVVVQHIGGLGLRMTSSP